MKKAEFDILFIEDEEGYSYPQLDYIGNILDWCKDNGLIGGGQGRYEVNGKSMFKDQARSYLEANPDMLDELTELAYSVGPETLKNKGKKAADDEE